MLQETGLCAHSTLRVLAHRPVDSATVGGVTAAKTDKKLFSVTEWKKGASVTGCDDQPAAVIQEGKPFRRGVKCGHCDEYMNQCTGNRLGDFFIFFK